MRRKLAGLDMLIRRPVEEVFAFATDINKAPFWHPNVKEARITSEGGMRPGANYYLVVRFPGRWLPLTAVVTEYDPPRRCAYKTTSGPLPSESILTCEAVEGGTRVRPEIWADVAGVWALLAPLLARKTRADLAANFVTLKHILEVGAERPDAVL